MPSSTLGGTTRHHLKVIRKTIRVKAYGYQGTHTRLGENEGLAPTLRAIWDIGVLVSTAILLIARRGSIPLCPTIVHGQAGYARSLQDR